MVGGRIQRSYTKIKLQKRNQPHISIKCGCCLISQMDCQTNGTITLKSTCLIEISH